MTFFIRKEKADKIIISKSGGKLITPPPGLKYLDFQVASIIFSIERNNSYLALEQGLGKSVCAAGIAKEMGAAVVYVVPPFLVKNAVNEFKRWAPELTVDVYGNDKMVEVPKVLIIPSTLITREHAFEDVLSFLRYWGEYVSTIIVDEAHYYKNDTSQRTKALLGHRIFHKSGPEIVEEALTDLFDKTVLMSGTPMPNSPIELYTVLSKLAPDTIGRRSRFDFGKRYCAAYKKHFGWDYSGSSNELELQRAVIHPRGPYMFRVLKKSVDLPEKIESVFVVSNDMSPRVASMDKKFSKLYDKEKDLIRAQFEKASPDGEELHIMSYRKLLGIEKVKCAAPYYESVLDDTDEKLIIFAYHNDVIEELRKALSKYKPIVITGKTPVNKRQALVDTFQKDKSVRLILGNYKAMGVGLTLTAARRAIFHEFSFVPGDNNQAADRIHRIGQNQTCFIQYVVFENSLDKRVIERHLTKTININSVLNAK